MFAHQIDWDNRRTSIGYWLAESAQGKGLMTKATRSLVNVVFSHYQLNRVEIRAAPENRKSRLIPERLGCIMEGQIRDAEWLYDHFVDHVIYSMLASEWDVAQGEPL